MEFCTISPIAGLNKWGTYLSNRHLVLAQLLYNKKYEEYYSTRSMAGDFLILDNGAYENTKPLDGPAYYNWIKNLSPKVAVLPDQLMSDWKVTTSLSLHFLDRYADELKAADYPTQWMFVPQMSTGDFSHFTTAVITVVEDGRQGHHVTWIGLGRYLATQWGSRVKAADWVRSTYPNLKLHALGMSAGNLDEMKALADLGVESIDSSCAVWRGWNGYKLDPYTDWEANGLPCNFHARIENMPDENHKLIQSNLEVIRGALNNGTRK